MDFQSTLTFKERLVWWSQNTQLKGHQITVPVGGFVQLCEFNPMRLGLGFSWAGTPNPLNLKPVPNTGDAPLLPYSQQNEIASAYRVNVDNDYLLCQSQWLASVTVASVTFLIMETLYIGN